MPPGTDMLLIPGQGKGSGFLERLRGLPVDSREEGRLSSGYLLPEESTWALFLDLDCFPGKYDTVFLPGGSKT